MPDGICSGRGRGWACKDTVFAKGWCKAHYMQRQRNPTRPLQPVRPRGDEPMVEVRFYLTDAEVKALGKRPGLQARELVRKALGRSGEE